MMKACRDCRHAEDRRCAHPHMAETLTDYYDATTRPYQPTCQEARQLCDCGPQAKFWEPREIGFGEP